MIIQSWKWLKSHLKWISSHWIMFNWQKNLYSFLSRNARPVKDYYNILPTQIIEIGLPIQL